MLKANAVLDLIDVLEGGRATQNQAIRTNSRFINALRFAVYL